MRPKLLSMMWFVVALSADDPTILKSPTEDAEIYYRGLSESETAMVKESAEQISKKAQLLEEKAMAFDDESNNCQCSHPELGQPECACLMQIPVLDLNIMHALGYNPEDQSMTLVLAVDEHIIINDRVKLSEQAKYETSCKALPPPTMWMAGCYKMKTHKEADGGFTVCSTIDINMMIHPSTYKTIMSMDFTCFVYKKSNGLDVLMLQGHNNREPDIGIKNMSIVKDFEDIAELFNKLKIKRLMKNPSGVKEVDVVEGDFWNDIEHNQVESIPVPHQVRAKFRQTKGDSAPKTWYALGRDEIPYLAILFKSMVSPKLASAQGLSEFEFIQDTIKRATAQKTADWHEPAIPDVFKPGLSCGGALLSPDKVLTICACIRSFYNRNKNNKPASGSGSKFDIDAEDIFIEFSTIQFTNKQYHHLDRDPSSYGYQAACFKLIEENKDDVLQAIMVVMPFTPGIPTQNPYRYVLWPPYPVHETYKRSPAVTWTAFGTNNKNSQPDEAMLIAVAIPMLRNSTTSYCTKETFHKSDTPAETKLKTTCFHARDPAYELCGGSIGFPITYGDELAGLSATPMDCTNKEGSMMGAVFDDPTVLEIESYVGGALKTRKEAAHNYLFREPSNIVRYIPDYTTVDAGPRQSSAHKIYSSHSWMAFLIFSYI